jgi:hypothetical protein
MSNLVEFRPRKREEDAYLLETLASVITTTVPYALKDTFTKIALAMYDEDKAAFDTAADELFSKREALVSRASGRHGSYKKEAEEAGNEYAHTLRPPKGYEWVPIEKD